jgi:Uma2 family endonuclease
MTLVTSPPEVTPEEVERASKRDGKRYELIDGRLKEKVVGTEALFIASRISERLNTALYPNHGFAAVEAMVYCFNRPNQGRKPDVVYVRLDRLADRKIPIDDLHVVPDLVVEVLSSGNSGFELEEKLNEYLGAGIPLVWIVNPERRTIRVYRGDGTTRLYRSEDLIEREALLPGFQIVPGDVFPAK